MNLPEWRQIWGLRELFAKHALSFPWLSLHLEQDSCGPHAQWGLIEPTANKIRWWLQSSLPFLILNLWTEMLEHRSRHTKLQRGEISSETGRSLSHFFVQFAEDFTVYQALRCGQRRIGLKRLSGCQGTRWKLSGVLCVWKGSKSPPGYGIYLHGKSLVHARDDPIYRLWKHSNKNDL